MPATVSLTLMPSRPSDRRAFRVRVDLPRLTVRVTLSLFLRRAGRSSARVRGAPSTAIRISPVRRLDAFLPFTSATMTPSVSIRIPKSVPAGMSILRSSDGSSSSFFLVPKKSSKRREATSVFSGRSAGAGVAAAVLVVNTERRTQRHIASEKARWIDLFFIGRYLSFSS